MGKCIRMGEVGNDRKPQDPGCEANLGHPAGEIVRVGSIT